MTDRTGENKAALRAEMGEQLKALTHELRHDRSTEICRRLTSLEEFIHADIVMLYMPLRTEVDLTPAAIAAFQNGATVCVPRMDWERRDMCAVEVSSFDDRVMDVDEHGIRTPRDGRLLVPTTVDLIVVPGLAFDVTGHRLGRGGGYYDRFLPRLRRSVTTVGLGFDLQIVESVPVDETDVPLDIIVTDRRTTRSRRSASKR